MVQAIEVFWLLLQIILSDLPLVLLHSMPWSYVSSAPSAILLILHPGVRQWYNADVWHVPLTKFLVASSSCSRVAR